MFVILAVLISLVCLALFAVALTYFIMGVKSYFSGRKENVREQFTGGVYTIFISLAAMVGISLLWRWLNGLLLH